MGPRVRPSNPSTRFNHVMLGTSARERVRARARRTYNGPIADERKKSKRDVKSHLNKCRARTERKRIQKRDELIQKNHPKRFRSNFQEKTVCTKLYSSGTVITDSKRATCSYLIAGLTTSARQADPNVILTSICLSPNETSTTFSQPLTANKMIFWIRLLMSKRQNNIPFGD